MDINELESDIFLVVKTKEGELIPSYENVWGYFNFVVKVIEEFGIDDNLV